jgi:nucleoside-diphosphate-sugar epimerase
MDLMAAPLEKLTHHGNYNVAAMSFRADELAAEIQKHLPEFVCEYVPDRRQAIADSWPRSIADHAARNEWQWQPSFDLRAMTEDMINRLKHRHASGQL